MCVCVCVWRIKVAIGQLRGIPNVGFFFVCGLWSESVPCAGGVARPFLVGALLLDLTSTLNFTWTSTLTFDLERIGVSCRSLAQRHTGRPTGLGNSCEMFVRY